MRTIENKKVKTEREELCYLGLCNYVLKNAVSPGYTVEEMRVRLDALKEFPVPTPKPGEGMPMISSPSRDVSEETYQELVRSLQGFRWPYADEEFVAFDKYIKELKDKAKKPAKKK